MKLRDDKSWDQATTSDQFADMYRKQIREAPARNSGADAAGAAQIRRVSEERDLEEVEGEEDDAEVEDAVSNDGEED